MEGNKIFVSLLVLSIIIMQACCSVPKSEMITEKHDTTITKITDRSFTVKDSFKLKLDTFGVKEFGFLNTTITRISGNQIVYDSVKICYDFKKNVIKADYKTKPDSTFKEIVTREKTISVMTPRPWSEIITYIAIGLVIAALILLVLYYVRKGK